MKIRTTILSAIGLTFSLISLCSGKDYHLYYLGGQSNMDGYGRVEELSADLNTDQPGIMIYQGLSTADGKPATGLGVWATLRPGHGADFRSDGKVNSYGKQFGCELTFAKTLRELRPDENIALIKYSRGGTSIASEAARNFGCWEPDYVGGAGSGMGVNQYDHFLATLRRALSVSDIDGDGQPDRLIPSGILWMQGESDAGFEKTALKYDKNLKRLMDLVRAALRVDDLPIAVGRISDSRHNDKTVWPFGDLVRKHQQTFCEKDGNAKLIVTTDQYRYSDPWHYDTSGYLELGTEFAKAIHSLRPAD